MCCTSEDTGRRVEEVHGRDWGVESVGSGSQLRTQSHGDTAAKQPPRGHIQTSPAWCCIINRDKKGWRWPSASGCVWLWWQGRGRREKRKMKKEGERQTDYYPQPWLSTPAALTPRANYRDKAVCACVCARTSVCTFLSLKQNVCVMLSHTQTFVFNACYQGPHTFSSLLFLPLCGRGALVLKHPWQDNRCWYLLELQMATTGRHIWVGKMLREQQIDFEEKEINHTFHPSSPEFQSSLWSFKHRRLPSSFSYCHLHTCSSHTLHHLPLISLFRPSFFFPAPPHISPPP